MHYFATRPHLTYRFLREYILLYLMKFHFNCEIICYCCCSGIAAAFFCNANHCLIKSLALSYYLKQIFALTDAYKLICESRLKRMTS